MCWGVRIKEGSFEEIEFQEYVFKVLGSIP